MSDLNTFVDALGKDVSATVVPTIEHLVRDSVAKLIQDVFQRYRAELAGELHTRIVQGGLEVAGRGIRLDLKHRETGESVSSLDIPVSLTIKIDALGVTLHDATVKLDVVG
jgi:hypothetical protein